MVTHLCTAWPTSVAEEAYWQAIRKQYMIAPDEMRFLWGQLSQMDLYDRYRITVPTAKSDGVYWIRVSTHICNGFDHVDRLIDALHEQRNE